MSPRKNGVRASRTARGGCALSAAELRHLDEQGYLALPRLVDPKRVAAMRARLDALLAATPQEHAGTLIVGGLFDEPPFDAAWLHPPVLAAARHLLGDDFRLVGVSSRGIRPGHGLQALHVDWGGQGMPEVWYACHAICALVDFTENNGATRVIPGSHRNPWLMKRQHDPRKPHPAQRQLVGPAGTVFVLNIHCFHSAMRNDSDEPRLAIFSHFSRRNSPIYQTDASPEPTAETLSRHPPEIQALLKA